MVAKTGGKILVWGAGAIGGTAGAFLARAGHDITFVDIDAEHVAAINADGLRIIGPVEEFTVRAPAFTPDAVEGMWDRIFLCVKAHHTAGACVLLRPHLTEAGYVVSLQNGLNELEIEAAVGRSRTIGAFVNFGADWMAPGEIMMGNRAAVVLGELDGGLTPRLAALLAVMQDFEPGAISTADIWGYLWGKLGYGAMLFAQALGQASIVECLGNSALFNLWREIGAEAVSVGLAEGARLRGFNGFDPAAFAPGATPEAAQASIDAMVAFNAGSAKTHSGVWRDLAVRKRQTEVDSQIAPISTIGARHGIACPRIDRLVAMIHEVEAGTRPMVDENLLELAR